MMQTPQPTPLSSANSLSRIPAAVAAVPGSSSTRGPPLMAPPQTPPPASLTSGMPDPMTVQHQKEGYVKSLDEQLKAGAAALDQQVKEQRDSVRAQAEKQKAVYNNAVDHEMRMLEMQVEHRFAAQVKELKQQAARQRIALEQQCLQLSHDYQTRKAEEDMLERHHNLHKEHSNLQEQMRAMPNVLATPLPSCPALKPVVPVPPEGVGYVSAPSPAPSYVPRVSSVMVAPGSASVLSSQYNVAYAPATVSRPMAPNAYVTTS